MIAKPPINVLLAHPTNMWSRYAKVRGVYTFIEFKNIVLHYVGAVSTAKNNADYLHRDANLGWSAHFFVDENSIWQSVDFDHAAGHCGVDYSGGKAPFQEENVNKKSIGIEMCECENRGHNHFRTWDRAAKLTAVLMKRFNINLRRVVPHYHWTRKNCPAPLLTNGKPGPKWAWFHSRVDYYYRCINQGKSNR